MAYITTEQVAAKRAKIKAAFPAKDGWKFSIRVDNHTSINVAVLKGPIEFKVYKCRPDEPNSPRNKVWGEDVMVNTSTHHTWIRDDVYPEETKMVLAKLYAIINEDNFDNSDTMTDYFHVGFYSHVTIGQWDRDYEMVKK